MSWLRGFADASTQTEPPPAVDHTGANTESSAENLAQTGGGLEVPATKKCTVFVTRFVAPYRGDIELLMTPRDVSLALCQRQASLWPVFDIDCRRVWREAAPQQRGLVVGAKP